MLFQIRRSVPRVSQLSSEKLLYLSASLLQLCVLIATVFHSLRCSQASSPLQFFIEEYVSLLIQLNAIVKLRKTHSVNFPFSALFNHRQFHRSLYFIFVICINISLPDWKSAIVFLTVCNFRIDTARYKTHKLICQFYSDSIFFVTVYIRYYAFNNGYNQVFCQVLSDKMCQRRWLYEWICVWKRIQGSSRDSPHTAWRVRKRNEPLTGPKCRLYQWYWIWKNAALYDALFLYLRISRNHSQRLFWSRCSISPTHCRNQLFFNAFSAIVASIL